MPDTDALNDIIRRYTIPYRKDAELIRMEDVGGIRVIHVNGYPEAPSHGELVDVHFLKVGFTEASADVEAFRNALKQALTGHGEFCDLTAKDFAGGPSYTTVGGWLGDQTQALLLFALIQHYGMGECITPERLRMPEDTWDAMAGAGYVMGMLRTSTQDPT